MKTRFRFHLSTMLAASFVTGVLIWANTASSEKPKTLKTKNGAVQIGRLLEYGWPMKALLIDKTWFWVGNGGASGIRDVIIVSREDGSEWKREWKRNVVFLDALVCALIVCLTFFILERFVKQ